MQIVTVKDMQRWETFAEECLGLSQATLMESAGRAVAREILSRVKERPFRAVIVCGTGNNGGDGFVCARALCNAGAYVHVLLLGDPERIKGAASVYFQGLDFVWVSVTAIQKADEALPHISDADVVVDALIGTGLSGAPSAEKAKLIEMMNGAPGLLVSIDVPSGVIADTGAVSGSTVQADVTVALGGLKRAHVLSPAAEFCGDIAFSDIGLPEKRGRKKPVFFVDRERIAHKFPERDRRAHKGENGFIGIIAGSADMAGAGLLAAQGALYAGAGKVELLTTKSVAQSLTGRIPEVMVRGVAAGDAFSSEDLETVEKAIESYDAVVIGPGLSRAEETQDFVAALLPKFRKPTVVDADALYAIAMRHIDLSKLPGQFVLTPHVGEFSRLSGLSPEEIEEKRIDVAISFAKEMGMNLVLKGAPTVTVDCMGTAFVNSTGNPGMATGGMGDTLSGIIAALAGQGVFIMDAAYVGVYWHGLAGDLLAKTTPIGFTAGDLARKLPEARALMEKE